jgi:hypothetical protein
MLYLTCDPPVLQDQHQAFSRLGQVFGDGLLAAVRSDLNADASRLHSIPPSTAFSALMMS